MARGGININASLIREVRMIAQRLMAATGGGSPAGYYDMKIAEARAKQPAQVLKCVPCLEHRKVFKDAIAVVRGNSVCKDHLSAIV